MRHSTLYSWFAIHVHRICQHQTPLIGRLQFIGDEMLNGEHDGDDDTWHMHRHTHTHKSCRTKMLWNFQLVRRRVDIWFCVHFLMKFSNFHSKNVTLNLAQFYDGIDRDWWHLCVHKLLLAMSPPPSAHGLYRKAKNRRWNFCRCQNG